MANQNKFTKSVLERLEQEAKKQMAASEDTVVKPQEKEKTVMEHEKETRERESINKEDSKRQANKKETPDLSRFINKSPERAAKNKTFYLDEEVIEALHQAAKSQKMTDSRLVNEVLRGVLGL